MIQTDNLKHLRHFIIIGVQKGCPTTSLDHYLIEQPQILPPVDKKNQIIEIIKFKENAKLSVQVQEIQSCHLGKLNIDIKQSRLKGSFVHKNRERSRDRLSQIKAFLE